MAGIKLRAVGMFLIAWATLAAPGAEATAEQGVAAPGVPDKLRPPQGHVLLFKTEAEGVQIYVSKEDDKDKFVWAFKAPLADLLIKGKKAGYHYAGPTWEALDGSRLVRDPTEEIAQVPAMNPLADIRWLRIKVRPQGAKGAWAKVSHVLRIQTQGGMPPGEPPARAGTEVGVRYKAVYEFYGPAR